VGVYGAKRTFRPVAWRPHAELRMPRPDVFEDVSHSSRYVAIEHISEHPAMVDVTAVLAADEALHPFLDVFVRQRFHHAAYAGVEPFGLEAIIDIAIMTREENNVFPARFPRSSSE
jgi:hypothetical protein